MSFNQTENKTPEQIDQIMKDAGLGIYVDESTLWNPLENIPLDLSERPHLWYTYLLSQPDYFYTLCKEILNVNLLPFQSMILEQLWTHKFPMLCLSRGGGKSFLLAVYAILRCLLLPGRKVIICGSAFRQSKIIFEYILKIWAGAPILRDIMGPNSKPRFQPDSWTFYFRDSTVMAIPIGTGETIRGLRANDVIHDEFAAGNVEIFETVIAGFTAVRSDPVENVKAVEQKKLKKAFKILDEMESLESRPEDNQVIIAGTAYYSFNHYYEYWERWRKIILSRGNKNKLSDILNDTDIPRGFNWKDYAIIRIPYNLLPEGYMDDAQISRAKATIDRGRFQNEYESVFAKDSNGYFRRTLIESCVVNREIHLGPEKTIYPFTATLYGDRDKQYVFGVDPASEQDNLALIILELNGDYRKIVYAWTINRKNHIKLVQEGLAKENDYYAYCARKIRTLMDRFPTDHIGIDSGGGGIALMEALHDFDKLKEGEVPLWPIINPDKPASSDGNRGRHILEMIQFSSADWVQYANTGLRKDFEDKACLFPAFDPAILAVAEASDTINRITLDTLEDAVIDIEELKDELSTIVMNRTPSGRERWDTPDKITDGKKGNMKKDRYSALLIANTIARKLYREPTPTYKGSDFGGFAGISQKKYEENPNILFHGQDWLVEKYKGVYD